MAAATAPWWCWPILAASVLAVSSAAVVFATMPDVPAIALAAWRLQLTSCFLLVGAAVQWRRAESDPRIRAAALAAAPLLATSGAWLALHFALWVASLQLTSLPHSVLIISLSPVLLVLHARFVGGPGAVALGEGLGVALAAAGAVVLSAGAAAASPKGGAGSGGGGASSSAHDVPASLLGDAAALAGCASVIPYLLIGRRLRTASAASPDAPPPLPLFLYTAPVTTVAAALLTVAGALIDSPPTLAESIFGWLLPGGGGLTSYGPRVLYLAVFPGIVGHTGFNFLLAHVAPLAVSLALDLECVVAPVMARLAGVTVAPLGVSTWVGGAMLVAAAVIVTVAGARRERAQAQGPGQGEEVAMARLPTHDPGDEGEEEEGRQEPLFSLAGDGGGDEEGQGKAGGVALAPEWAGLHRHRQ